MSSALIFPTLDNGGSSEVVQRPRFDQLKREGDHFRCTYVSTSYTATITATVSSSVCPATFTVKRAVSAPAALLGKRNNLPALSIFAASQLSSGCSCLGLKPKVTVASTITAAPVVSIFFTSCSGGLTDNILDRQCYNNGYSLYDLRTTRGVM